MAFLETVFKNALSDFYETRERRAMLDEALNRARAIITSEIDEAQEDWVRRVGEIQANHAKRGVLNSTIYIGTIADACSAELVSRAKIIWEGLKGCTTSLARHRFDGLGPDIVRAFKSYLDVQTDLLASTIEQSAHVADAAYAARRVMQFRNRADGILAEYEAKTYLFLEHRGHMPDVTGGGDTVINIHGNLYGNLMTGAGATAHANINIDTKTQTLAALDKLEELLPSLPASQQEVAGDIREVAGSVRKEITRSPRPNPMTIMGLLSGLGTTIRSLGELKPAYQLLQGVLSAHFGVTLPDL